MKLLGKLLFLLLLLVARVSPIYAQTPEAPTANNADNEDRTVLMRDEFSGGAILHSAGWGITLRRAKQETYMRKKFIELDIVSMKDPKEVRTVNAAVENAKSFIYGKMNDFYVTRIGIGKQHILFAKAHTTGVEVRYHYSFGLSLGITKPIYLIIKDPIPNYDGSFDTQVLKYNPDPAKPFLDSTSSDCVGNASFTSGLGEMKLHPGGYFKSGMSFEYAKFPDQIWSIETGFVIDIYPQEIPIMAFIDNKKIFFNFYVSLSYGGKW